MHDPFGRSQLPADFGREHRVRLLAEAARAWLAGQQPSDAARLFVAGGIVAWLERDGDLLGDFWKVRGRQGSTHTPAKLLQLALREERRSACEPLD